MMPPSQDKDRLKKRNENRYRFLRVLFDASGDGHDVAVDMSELGEKIGLSEDETEDAVSYLEEKRLLETYTLEGLIGITRPGIREVESTIENPERATPHSPVPVIHNYNQTIVNQNGSHNTANVGNTSNSSISKSDVGSVAVGPYATATHAAAEDRISKDEFLALIKEAQTAWVADQDRLGDELSDGLWQILGRLRKLEFEMASVGEVQAKIKVAVDDQAVADFATKVKASGISGDALKVFEVLAKSPATAPLLQHLFAVISPHT